jgi:hypothetical protein
MEERFLAALEMTGGEKRTRADKGAIYCASIKAKEKEQRDFSRWSIPQNHPGCKKRK